MSASNLAGFDELDSSHQAGDLLLCAVADLLRGKVRDVDVVARLGGDEFAILLPESDAEAARLILNKIEGALRDVVATCEYRCAVTFSAGAVTFARPLGSVAQMIQRADEVMYTVKQNGKGRIVQEVLG